jgi:hypothetical protein
MPVERFSSVAHRLDGSSLFDLVARRRSFPAHITVPCRQSGLEPRPRRAGGGDEAAPNSTYMPHPYNASAASRTSQPQSEWKSALLLRWACHVFP